MFLANRQVYTFWYTWTLLNTQSCCTTLYCITLMTSSMTAIWVEINVARFPFPKFWKSLGNVGGQFVLKLLLPIETFYSSQMAMVDGHLAGIKCSSCSRPPPFLLPHFKEATEDPALLWGLQMQPHLKSWPHALLSSGNTVPWLNTDSIWLSCLCLLLFYFVCTVSTLI